jgi:hypothetical protein
MRQNDLLRVSCGRLRDIQTRDPISCGYGPRDPIPTQVETDSADEHETDRFFQYEGCSLG